MVRPFKAYTNLQLRYMIKAIIDTIRPCNLNVLFQDNEKSTIANPYVSKFSTRFVVDTQSFMAKC